MSDIVLRCSACRAFNRKDEYGGHCRLKSPVVTVIPHPDKDTEIVGLWPWVANDDWCLELLEPLHSAPSR